MRVPWNMLLFATTGHCGTRATMIVWDVNPLLAIVVASVFAMKGLDYLLKEPRGA